ncbi:MAG: TolB family protein [Actinomycetota bacterium]
MVAYVDQDDLWLYEVGTDQPSRLTDDGDERIEGGPTFLGRGCVLYTSSDPTTIQLLQVSGAAPPLRVVEEEGYVHDLDVSPDGSSIVYLQIDYDVDSTYRLKRVAASGGEPVVLYTFSQNGGRGAGSEDAVSVAWSPDGGMILVTNTHGSAFDFDEKKQSIFLLSPDGSELAEPWTGTHAQWSPDGKSIYYRGYAGVNGQDWYRLDVASMQAEKLGMRAGTNGLSISPDGKRAAYDTSYFGDFPLETKITKETPVVYVYNLSTGNEILLKSNGLAPLWISTSRLLVTNAKEPGYTLNSWDSLGTVSELSLDGKSSIVSMTSTLFGAAVLVGG